jgi:hypothetical protein
MASRFFRIYDGFVLGIVFSLLCSFNDGKRGTGIFPVTVSPEEITRYSLLVQGDIVHSVPCTASIFLSKL